MSSQGGAGGGGSDRLMKAVNSRSIASKKAGLQFPVHTVTRHLFRGKHTKEVTRPATVYLSAVLQYIAAEVLENAGNQAREENETSILAGHIRFAVTMDEGLKKLLGELFEPASMNYDAEFLSGMLGGLTIDDNNGGGDAAVLPKHSSTSDPMMI